MVNSQATFLGQFFYILIAERIAAVPTYTKQDDRGHKVTPLKQTRLGHVWRNFTTQASYPTMNSVSATTPII